MNYESTIKSIEAEGFSWDSLRDYFPFGDISLREGNYQRLLQACLGSLVEDSDRIKLLDLLDAQGCVFLEQCWVQNEQVEGDNDKPFGIHAHFASAWLQINSNMRYEFNLPRQDPRGVMLKLPAEESLISRMLVTPNDT